MPEMVVSIGKIIDQGFAALAVVAIVLSFIWNQWKMAPVMAALVASSNALLRQVERIETQIVTENTTLGKHDQRAEDMHGTCKSHTVKLDDLSERIARIEGKMSA